MQIGIIGTGNVGGALGTRWALGGHEVVFGSRHPQSDEVRALIEKSGERARVASVAEAATCPVILLATPWPTAREVIESMGHLEGKTLIDAVNPVEPSLTALSLGTTTSASEQIAQWASGAHVVKAFNTVGAGVMANTDFSGGRVVMFYCGDDAPAKQTVHQLAAELDFDPVDAGPLTQARVLEPFALLWITLAVRQGLGAGIAFEFIAAVKVAAYQAPLLAAGSAEAIGLIRERVSWCESEGVSILCCPEAILGGLADYSNDPIRFAIRADEISNILAPLASDTVTSIIGFSELSADGQLYNAAAVLHRGGVAGVYRKQHPAIRRSVYSAGSLSPVFQVGELTFGIVICNDSNFSEPARAMAAQGAVALFIPSNNGLPNHRAYPELVQEARATDITRAVENHVWVIRADVAGENGELMSHGASGIVDPEGKVVQQTSRGVDILVADIGP